MFCEECGTKNANDAQFCENCGAKLKVEKKLPKKSPKTEPTESFSTKLKKMSKTKKMIGGIVIVFVVICIIAYSVINNKLSPKTIAKDYFLAAANMDAEKLYQYMEVEKSEFTSKSMFKKLFEEKYDEDDIKKIANYSVGKVEKDASGFTATVTITYVENGDDDSNTVKVKLIKQKAKKYLIFDEWQVATDNMPMEITKDFEMKVLKGSKIKIEGKEVNSKYIDKEKSDESYDVYKMPAMFTTEYSAVISAPMGFDVEEKIRVSKYSNYTYSLSEDNLSDEMKKQLTDLAKTSLQTLYDGAKDQKEFSEIKSSFDYKGADLTDLEKSYNSLKNSLANSGLTSISFTEVTLNSFSSSDTYRCYVSTKYKYSVNYTSGTETKTHDSSDSDNMYVYLTYADGAFRVVDAGSMTTYFSKYY